MKNSLIAYLKKSPKFLFWFAGFYSFNSFFLIKGRCKNKIRYTSSFLKNTKIDISGVNNIVTIDVENRLKNCLVHISGSNCQVTIDRHCILANLEIWLEDNKSSIHIGANTTVEGGHIASTEGQSITIGEDCMFSHRIEIRNGDSHAILDKVTKQKINPAKSVTIGNHVWLGADVKILKGSIIADNCIVAAAGIVTGKCDSNAIYGGIPAHIKKLGRSYKFA
jgi:acetyltransferase-like isoleucine patch superfamily enzyme